MLAYPPGVARRQLYIDCPTPAPTKSPTRTGQPYSLQRFLRLSGLPLRNKTQHATRTGVAHTRVCTCAMWCIYIIPCVMYNHITKSKSNFLVCGFQHAHRPQTTTTATGAAPHPHSSGCMHCQVGGCSWLNTLHRLHRCLHKHGV